MRCSAARRDSAGYTAGENSQIGPPLASTPVAARALQGLRKGSARALGTPFATGRGDEVSACCERGRLHHRHLCSKTAALQRGARCGGAGAARVPSATMHWTWILRARAFCALAADGRASPPHKGAAGRVCSKALAKRVLPDAGLIEMQVYSNCHLCTNFDDTIRRDLEIRRRVLAAVSQPDEELLLPVG
jgi:hypothetical protein